MFSFGSILAGFPPYNEQDLLLRVSQGDETAFARLVEPHKNNIFTSAWKITGSKAIAEDILQEVFLSLWLKREKLPELENFPGYLFTMAQNAIFDALRNISKRREKGMSLHPDDPAFSHTDTENTLRQREYAVILHRAIESLPPKQKQTYILIKQDGLKRGETATLLQVSAETVKFNLEEAMRKVRAFCQAHISLLILLLPLIEKKF